MKSVVSVVMFPLRYDMPGYRPNKHYVRWMKHFGVLPEGFDLAKDTIDPYDTDRA